MGKHFSSACHLFLILLIVSCKHDDLASSLENNSIQEENNQALTKLGEELENPFTVENM